MKCCTRNLVILCSCIGQKEKENRVVMLSGSTGLAFLSKDQL